MIWRAWIWPAESDIVKSLVLQLSSGWQREGVLWGKRPGQVNFRSEKISLGLHKGSTLWPAPLCLFYPDETTVASVYLLPEGIEGSTSGIMLQPCHANPERPRERRISLQAPKRADRGLKGAAQASVDEEGQRWARRMGRQKLHASMMRTGWRLHTSWGHPPGWTNGGGPQFMTHAPGSPRQGERSPSG